MKSETTEPRAAQRRALGRGLESLLPSRPSLVSMAAPEPESEALRGPREISVDLIDRNPYQTRTSFDPEKLSELAKSIAATGVVQPIIVRGSSGGRYQLITGERRLLASKEVGKKTIPAVLREVSDEQAMEMTIVENLQRADLNPMEQARAYARLHSDFQMTQEQIATRTGKERASVANFLRLLKLPHSVQHRVESGELSFGHARTLLSLPNPEQILSAAQKVVALSLSVRQTESYVQGLIHPEEKQTKSQRPAAEQDPNVREAQDRLQRSLGLRVRIEDKRGKGRVVIEYANLDDFDALLTAFNAQTLN